MKGFIKFELFGREYLIRDCRLYPLSYVERYGMRKYCKVGKYIITKR